MTKKIFLTVIILAILVALIVILVGYINYSYADCYGKIGINEAWRIANAGDCVKDKELSWFSLKCDKHKGFWTFGYKDMEPNCWGDCKVNPYTKESQPSYICSGATFKK